MNKKIAILGGLVSLLVTAGIAQASVKVVITQAANVKNESEAKANTGKNDQYKVTKWSLDTIQDGDQIITTGDADAQADSLSVTNKNEMDIRNSITAGRNHRYGDEEEEEEACDCADVDVEVTSAAEVDNESEADANTGKNDQDLKLKDVEVADQNGKQDIWTGRADSRSDAEQFANTTDLTIDAEVIRASRRP